jgi:UDP-N-acetyl-2-amino-2-deoxyglucuronate dehydrogenase
MMSAATKPAGRGRSMEPLKYALIGCGKVAVKHLKAALYQQKRGCLRIVALVDARPEAAALLGRACGLSEAAMAGIPVYEDIERMLAEQSPDLVAITTPSGSHFAVASAAIASGAHVLVEKPLTLSLDEADQLLVEAQNQNVQIAVGHIYRFFPLVQQLQADLREGRFGRILYGDVKVRWGHDQAYYDQAAWRGTWEQDGGALMNQSIHALDLMTWLLGSPAVEVSGWISRLCHRMEAEDFGLAMLRLADGSYCQVEGTTCTDPARQEASFAVIGSAGELRCGLRSGKPFIEIRDRRGKNLAGRYLRRYLHEQLRVGGLASLLQLKNPHSGLYDNLVRAIRMGERPLADGYSGRQAIELVMAIYESARTNRPVQLPLRDFSLQNMADFLPASKEE